MSAIKGIEPIQREPIAVEIARRLVEYLLSGEIEPGTRIPGERQLAEAFGVGRSAMREAIKSLTLIGLVEVRHGDGTYLRRSEDSLLPQVIEWGLLLGEPLTADLVEARQKIEKIMAGLAAERRTEEELAALRAEIMRMDAARDASADIAEFIDADVQFHRRVAEAAHNAALRDVLGSVQSLLRAWIRRVMIRESRDSTFAEHVPIFEAIARGDVRGAEEAMDAHMVSAGKRLASAVAVAQAERTVARAGGMANGP
ncbi:MAG: FadR/GntR family transcriptional regulator [Chloroflexota bacterium]